jgi:hypothetical protein
MGDIPAGLRSCFQEYDFAQLDLVRDSELIMERTLAYGSRAELCWLFGQYGRTRVTDWVRQSGGRRLPWRRYNLWCVLLDLPPARRARPEEQRIWPY